MLLELDLNQWNSVYQKRNIKTGLLIHYSRDILVYLVLVYNLIA